MDPLTEALIAGLKTAAAATDPMPLVRSGKQPGIFPGKTGSTADAAQKALADGLLQAVGRDPRGKSDLVEITPRGIQFLYQHESPRKVLVEVLAALEAHRQRLPRWHEELAAQVQALTARFQQLLDRQAALFEQLTRRAEEALRRIDARAPAGMLLPWQLDALNYLDARAAVGKAGSCPLAELFQALRGSQADLLLPQFHEGVIALRDHGAIDLEPLDRPLSELAEPEFALVEGAAVYHAVRRR